MQLNNNVTSAENKASFHKRESPRGELMEYEAPSSLVSPPWHAFDPKYNKLYLHYP